MFRLREQCCQQPHPDRDHGADDERGTDNIAGLVPGHLLWRHV